MNRRRVYEVINENCPYAAYTCPTTGVTMTEYHLYGGPVVQVAFIDQRPVEWLALSHPHNRWFIGHDLNDLRRIAQKYAPWGITACEIEMVTLPSGLRMGKYPITQAQYYAVMGNIGSCFMGDNRPVDSVSYGEARQFCTQLSDLTGVAYDIPSDYEWEYACRAGTRTVYSFGDDPALLDQYGWYKGNSNRMTQAVGLKTANPWGLHDMHGHIQEWVTIADGKVGSFALCGGCYWKEAANCTSASIRPEEPAYSRGCGFRVAVRDEYTDGDEMWRQVHRLRVTMKGGGE